MNSLYSIWLPQVIGLINLATKNLYEVQQLNTKHGGTRDDQGSPRPFGYGTHEKVSTKGRPEEEGDTKRSPSP